MQHLILFTYLSIAIGFSFLCSIAEAVLLSITPSFLADQKRDPSKASQRVVTLKQNVDRPLSAILSLNTIAHTVGAAGVGAQAANIYGDDKVGIISAILTLLILVFSEIIPKTIGAMHWRRLAKPVSLLVQWLIYLMFPLVWMSEFLTRILSQGNSETLVTRSEIAAIAELGSEQGLLDEQESVILRNLLKLRQIQVEDVMTPRTVAITLEQHKTLDEVAMDLIGFPVSRIPIYNDQPDAVSGFVLKSELLAAIAAGDGSKSVEDFKRPLIHVNENDSLSQAFDRLLSERAHIALVTDRFGGMEGLITIEDVIETLLEVEIVDEQDTDEDMRKVAKQKWEERRQRQQNDSNG